MRSSAPQERRANRLGSQKSPYLLQHQYNPVDWFPWGPEAFARAQAEQKPIFLSIGYSTCHWCHVMERESFEDDEVARFLNEHFVSIKVDREERPDVDKIYMSFVQAMTGQGGWPLNVFLTPDRKPFFGGTYFPPSNNRHGRPGFLQVLQQLAGVWKSQRAEVDSSADHIHQQLSAFALQGELGKSLPGSDALDRAAALLKNHFDPRYGGFGNAPKFPQPSQPRFLLSYAEARGDSEARRMVLQTCDRMAAGGINDQLGGGFSRYSVDAEWLVPHFEKMLYDNAQLVQLYLDAFLASGRTRYAETVRQIIQYVLRDMTHPEGGFFSAEDADSEGHEGKFYCWTREELERLLDSEEYPVAARYFGITEQGNFIDHSHPHPLQKQNVLSIVAPDLDDRETALLQSAKAKMLAARGQRVRPHLDDKILASWNGLMLGALSRAGAILGEESWLEAARKNLRFIRTHLWDASGHLLYHRWREGERDQVQLHSAYGFVLDGVLDLYEATLEPEHLEFAILVAKSMTEMFFDRESGGFWQSASTADLIFRIKEDYDGAEPSSNSVATLALLRLGKITGREDFTDIAMKTLRFFSGRLEGESQAMPVMLQALGFALEEPRRVVIAGALEDPGRTTLLRAAHQVYRTNKVILGTQGPVEPFARTLPLGPLPQAYICSGTSCQAPVTTVEDVRTILKGRP
jgi:uncharacterized protein YyaL (SSP411 family)